MNIIFDFENKFSFLPYCKENKKNYKRYIFKKNPISKLSIFRIIKNKINGNCIFPTSDFKRNEKYYDTFDKYYNKKNPVFENLCFECLDIILKSMRINFNSIYICSAKKDDRINNIIDTISGLTETIYLYTQNDNFFEETNNYSLEKYGLGLLKKNTESFKDATLIIVLNDKRYDYSKNSTYVINLMKNHPLFGCNILYDFYDESCFKMEDIHIRKAYFTENKTGFFKLKWKIYKN